MSGGTPILEVMHKTVIIRPCLHHQCHPNPFTNSCSVTVEVCHLKTPIAQKENQWFCHQKTSLSEEIQWKPPLKKKVKIFTLSPILINIEIFLTKCLTFGYLVIFINSHTPIFFPPCSHRIPLGVKVLGLHPCIMLISSECPLVTGCMFSILYLDLSSRKVLNSGTRTQLDKCPEECIQTWWIQSYFKVGLVFYKQNLIRMLVHFVACKLCKLICTT